MSDGPPSLHAAPAAGGAFAALRRWLALALVAGALIGFAADGRADDGFDDDPLEGYNRVMFEVNQTIDSLVLKPAAELYVALLPVEVRNRVSNVLDNLGEPLNLVNNMAQGKFERAGSTLTRFAINSTVGVAGIFDVATDWGYPHAPEDFGQTLGTWGLGGEPFLMLPLLGPSSPRDALGFAVDWVADPVGHIMPAEGGLARGVTSGVSRRAEFLDEYETLESTSVDFYAALRELYKQYRENDIRDGAPPPTLDVPDYDWDEDVDAE